MILLLGGTADTDAIVTALVQYGYSVLVSTASNYPITIPIHHRVQRRWGNLDPDALTTLLTKRNVDAIVDATHPYAEIIGPMAQAVAATLKIPYFRFLRPVSRIERPNVILCANHDVAAQSVFALGVPVLLTIGANNIRPYIIESRRTVIPVVVRVLNRSESIACCRDMAVPSSHIIAKRGPFSIDENISLIRQFQIGALVTKDGGKKGGFPQKLLAAEQTGCKVILVERPLLLSQKFFTNITALVDAMGVKTQYPAGP